MGGLAEPTLLVYQVKIEQDGRPELFKLAQASRNDAVTKFNVRG